MRPDQVILELAKKVDFLSDRLSVMEKKNQELKKESRELNMRVQRLEAFEENNKILVQKNTELRDENADLKSKIADLETRLNSNSGNSSKPPSSDGYKKKPAFPKKKMGKQGGKKGHKGRFYNKLSIRTK